MTVDFNKIVPVRWHKLADDMDMLSRKMTTRTASFAIRVRAGGWDTNDDNEGVAHFLEHMMFKDAGGLTSNEINRRFQEFGVDANAWTWYADTNYYITGVAGDDFYKAVALLCNMLSSTSWTNEELEKERSVILEERNLYDDQTSAVLGDKLTREIYKDHPFGRDELGTVDQINAITTEKLRDFYNKYYTSGNIVMVAAGDIDEECLDQVVTEHLNLPIGTKNTFQDRIKIPEIPAQRHDYDHECESAHILVCLPVGIRTSVPEDIALCLGMSAIGDGMSSRLWDVVREELGLAYAVGGRVVAERHYTYITASAGTSHDTVDTCVEAMTQTMENAFHGGITEEELKRVKIDFIKNLVFNSESASGTVNRLANQYMMLGYTISVEEVEDIVRNTTLDDVNNVLASLSNDFVIGTISRRS